MCANWFVFENSIYMLPHVPMIQLSQLSRRASPPDQNYAQRNRVEVFRKTNIADNRRAEADLRRSRSKALSRYRDSLVALESHAAVDEISFENSITKFHRKRSVAIREIVYTQKREEERSNPPRDYSAARRRDL